MLVVGFEVLVRLAPDFTLVRSNGGGNGPGRRRLRATAGENKSACCACARTVR